MSPSNGDLAGSPRVGCRVRLAIGKLEKMSAAPLDTDFRGISLHLHPRPPGARPLRIAARRRR